MAGEDPNGFAQSNPPNDGLPKIKSIFDFTAEALEEFAVWLEMRGLTTPVSQLIGFHQFTAQAATPVFTAQSTASATYTDLTTVGPQLTGLPSGQYVVLFGSYASTNPALGAGWMSVQANSVAAADNDAAAYGADVGIPGCRGIVMSLSDPGSNTLTAKYRTDGGATASFARRWLIALKFANA